MQLFMHVNSHLAIKVTAADIKDKAGLRFKKQRVLPV